MTKAEAQKFIQQWLKELEVLTDKQRELNAAIADRYAAIAELEKVQDPIVPTPIIILK